MIRIFSEKNKAKFLVLRDVNISGNRYIRFQMLMNYNEFADIVHSGLEKFFPFTKLSRSKAKD